VNDAIELSMKRPQLQAVTELAADVCPTPHELATCVPGIDSARETEPGEMLIAVNARIGDDVVRRTVSVTVEQTVDGGWHACWQTSQPTDVLRSVEVDTVSLPRDPGATPGRVSIAVRAWFVEAKDPRHMRRATVLVDRVTAQTVRNLEAALLDPAAATLAGSPAFSQDARVQHPPCASDGVFPRRGIPMGAVAATLMVPVLAAIGGWLWQRRGGRRP
jgi:hypothetical protein